MKYNPDLSQLRSNWYFTWSNTFYMQRKINYLKRAVGREGVLYLDKAFNIYCNFSHQYNQKATSQWEDGREQGVILQSDNENSQKASKNCWISQT